MQQIKVIAQQNKEIEKYKVPQSTPVATPVEIATIVTTDNADDIHIKCNKCNFDGRTMNDLREHKRTKTHFQLK